MRVSGIRKGLFRLNIRTNSFEDTLNTSSEMQPEARDVKSIIGTLKFNQDKILKNCL